MQRSASLVCLLTVAGCNAVYFYETDKVSLSIETRPDPTAPVAANFGIKQRVVAVVPSTDVADTAGGVGQGVEALVKTAHEKGTVAAQATPASADAISRQEQSKKLREAAAAWLDALNADSRGDALSVISTFRFRKFPKADGDTWTRPGRIKIDGALITGTAAMDIPNAGRAIAALSGGPAVLTAAPYEHAALEQIYDAIKSAGASNPHLKEDAQRLDGLAQSLPATYPFNFYAINGADPAAFQLDTGPKAGDPVTRQNFSDVTRYWGQLDDTITTLEHASARTQPFTVGGVTVNGLMKQGLQAELEANRKLRDQFRATVTASPTIKDVLRDFAKGF